VQLRSRRRSQITATFRRTCRCSVKQSSEMLFASVRWLYLWPRAQRCCSVAAGANHGPCCQVGVGGPEELLLAAVPTKRCCTLPDLGCLHQHKPGLCAAPPQELEVLQTSGMLTETALVCRSCRQGTGSPQQLADLRTVSRSFRRAASRAVCLKLAPASLRESEVRMLAAFPSVRHLDLSNVPDGVRRRSCSLRTCFMPAFAVCRTGRSLGLGGGITTVTQMLLICVSVDD
jgi:hypothetical protein